MLKLLLIFMVFVDNLAYDLFALSFSGFLLFYTTLSIYFVYKKKGKNISDYFKSSSMPLGLMGGYLLLAGLWGQFTWPLPGSYNILFYDPLISFGILLLGYFFSARQNMKFEYVGFLGMLFGIMVIIYGIEGYSIGLTTVPIALFGLYFLYGVVGILMLPISFIADRLSEQKKNPLKGRHIIFVLFCIFLLFASLLAAYIGASAIPAHLLNPP